MIYVKVQYPGGKEEIEGILTFPSVDGVVNGYRIEKVVDLRGRDLVTPDRQHKLEAMIWLSDT